MEIDQTYHENSKSVNICDENFQRICLQWRIQLLLGHWLIITYMVCVEYIDSSIAQIKWQFKLTNTNNVLNEMFISL